MGNGMSPLQVRQSSLAGLDQARPEFTLDEFKRSLTQHGYDARWSKAILCPNRDPNQEDHHRVNCELCDHNGFVYYDPIDIRTLVTSFNNKQMFMPESRYDPGTAYFTTLPEHKISFWDKIEITTARTRFTQVVKTKPVIPTYRLKYSAKLNLIHLIHRFKNFYIYK